MDLKCFDKVIVDKPEVSKESIKTRYTLEYDGKSVSYELRNKYETNIIGPNIQMHANLIATVPAINEGLFADDIILNYDLTPAQYQFFSVMLDKMCREIFVNEFLTKPLYIKNEFLPKENDIRLEHVRPRARLYSGIEKKIYESVETDNNKAIVMSSGGKESLLSYGILKDAGLDVYPVFMNESGGHWKTALPAYRAFKEHDPNTSKVWHNLDRLFIFLLRNMKILDQNIIENRSRKAKGVTAVADPINLFSFSYPQFSMLPLAEKLKVGNLCMGTEYDDPYFVLEGKNRINGIEYSPVVYDQTIDYDSYINNLLRQDGLSMKLWSPVGPITGFQVEKMLANKYPSLFKLQRSCHHTHSKQGDSFPCGTCQKCLRVLSFCIASKLDYKKLNYTDEQMKMLGSQVNRLKLGKEELEHTFYNMNKHSFDINGRMHSHIEMLHFDNYTSQMENIPEHIRNSIYSILLSSSLGAVKMDKNNKWGKIDI